LQNKKKFSLKPEKKIQTRHSYTMLSNVNNVLSCELWFLIIVEVCCLCNSTRKVL